MASVNRRRKPHSKSRGGCLQCKERHAKCNEVHPRCRQCDRANIPCSFSSSSLTAVPLNEDSLADLELLEHWHRHPIVGDHTNTARRLFSDFVRLGFSHHYVLNSILGLTALHLYSEDKSQSKWYARAVAHHQAAISRAKPHFQSLHETNSQALLGFSAFMSMYAVAEPFLRPSRVLALQTTKFDPLEELLRAYQFTRSATAFVRQNFNPATISQSWLLTTFEVRFRSELLDLETTFPRIRPLLACIERRSEGNLRAACFSAISQISRRITALLDRPDDPEMPKIIWSWGLEANQLFLDMCSARQPVALVTLAHFTILMSLHRDHWGLRGWPEGLLRHIKGLLGDEWECAVQWPCDVVFGSEVVSFGPAIGNRLVIEM
ncbi:Putative zn(2)Cys(6) fungal-type DNA-binding domain-containing protein [Colletotrichum destructivum]|uniref:Zn(2)Cys(6) fungal-type DNA-binding domain-containing protein n=1 Tax=Colletotrichum destructivum TaxID=34406 RepID=A0AAX4J416_9PEZI|nr:Putative zn(2)Cys(6) fungal-type DNA-binding domain-containing protein [Colletotrichum destructivum]